MVTIIIPTINRSEFLIRLLKYYNETGFKGCICIGDSSTREHVEKTKKVIESLRSDLNIRYLEFPGLDCSNTKERLVATIDTPYAALCGDDDILITPALEKSVEFLDEHLEFNAAWGRAIKIRLESEGGAHGRIVKCARKIQPVVEGDSACKRLLNWVNFGTDVIFAVHRTECFKKMYLEDTYLIEEHHAHGGIPATITSVINGKVKELPKLYLIRQTHSKRARFSKDYPILRKNAFKRITSPQWFDSYQFFFNRIVTELIEKDSVSEEIASEVAEQVLFYDLNTKMQRLYKKSYPEGPYLTPSTIPSRKDNLCGIALPDLVVNLARAISHKVQPNRKYFEELSLPSLLNSKSPYNDDFMPAYKIISQLPTLD